MKFLGQRRRPFVLSNALPDCLSRFVQQIFAIKSRSRRKTEKNVKVLWPPFFREGRRNFSMA